MITPDEIRQKVERLYPTFVKAWLHNEPFFPYLLRANKKSLSSNVAEDAQARRALRAKSKETLGHGYSVEWVRKNSRTQGDNEFPDRITLDTQADLLRLIGKTEDFERLTANVDELRAELPELDDWILRSSNSKHLRRPISDLRRLIAVVRYFRKNPRPNCYAREIPVEVDTKFIETNERILKEWLDAVLPADAVRYDETKSFGARFYLRTVEPLIPVRVLCDKVKRTAGLPFEDFGLRLSCLKTWDAPRCRVLIVENEVPLLTLPRLPNTIAIGKLGNAAVVLRDVPWIVEQPVIYWGDIDVPGFEILERFRRDVPGTKSVLMDAATLAEFRGVYTESWSPKKVASAEPPALPLLDENEKSAAETCFRDRLRLEQERIPLTVVRKALEAINC